MNKTLYEIIFPSSPVSNAIEIIQLNKINVVNIWKKNTHIIFFGLLLICFTGALKLQNSQLWLFLIILAISYCFFSLAKS